MRELVNAWCRSRGLITRVKLIVEQQQQRQSSAPHTEDCSASRSCQCVRPYSRAIDRSTACTSFPPTTEAGVSVHCSCKPWRVPAHSASNAPLLWIWLQCTASYRVGSAAGVACCDSGHDSRPGDRTNKVIYVPFNIRLQRSALEYTSSARQQHSICSEHTHSPPTSLTQLELPAPRPASNKEVSIHGTSGVCAVWGLRCVSLLPPAPQRAHPALTSCPRTARATYDPRSDAIAQRSASCMQICTRMRFVS